MSRCVRARIVAGKRKIRSDSIRALRFILYDVVDKYRVCFVMRVAESVWSAVRLSCDSSGADRVYAADAARCSREGVERTK
jgi:hypothetical protein